MTPAGQREAVVRMLDRHHQDVTAAAQAAANPSPPVQPQEPVQPHPSQPEPVSTEEKAKIDDVTVAAPDQSTPLSTGAEHSINRRAKRLARYEQILHLRQSGVGIRSIAKQMVMGRETVKKFLRAGADLFFSTRPSRNRVPAPLSRW
jgi:hypothetical protein